MKAEALLEAQRTAGVASLAERLLSAGVLSERDMLQALMVRHHLRGGDVPAKVVNRNLRRLLPAELARVGRVAPVALRDGVLTLACSDLPSEGILDRIRHQVRLPAEYHLVTPPNPVRADKVHKFATIDNLFII